MNRKAAFSYGCILMAAALWGGIGISVRYIAGFGLTSMQNKRYRNGLAEQQPNCICIRRMEVTGSVDLKFV